MKYRNLKFEEIMEGVEVAIIPQKADYKIQVNRTANGNQFIHDAKLTDDRLSTVDSEEGLDAEGVEAFIDKAEDLVNEITGIAVDMAMEQGIMA